MIAKCINKKNGGLTGSSLTNITVHIQFSGLTRIHLNNGKYNISEIMHFNFKHSTCVNFNFMNSGNQLNFKCPQKFPYVQFLQYNLGVNK